MKGKIAEALLKSGKLPSGDEPDGDEPETDDEYGDDAPSKEEESIASELVDSLSGGDPKTVALALKNFIRACGAYQK